ncbi:MAG TPA: hypothetical protein VMX58_01145 [Patescibacteria group bacterium]|nr:hypothetical protein [Patescibacteria group bacterium]
MEPDDENPPDTFTITYEADQSRAVSVRIGAAAGGGIEAQSADGVTFALEIPPGALEADTTITIAPLSSFTIAGPGSACMEGCGTGENGCLRGALFEPSGLVFIEPVDLTVTFGVSVPCCFDSVGTLICFDSSWDHYEPCSTAVDPDHHLLTAKIRHFTGYGTAAPDSAQLWAIFNAMSGSLQAYIGNSGVLASVILQINDLLSCATVCDRYLTHECRRISPELDAAADAACLDALQSHSNLILMANATEHSRESADKLIEACERFVYAYSNLRNTNMALATMRTAWLAGIDQTAHSLAEAAHAMCESGNCDGKNILSYVLGIGSLGYVTDTAFLDTVSDWLTDCCAGLDVRISSDSPTVCRGALSEEGSALRSAYVTITVTVTTASGEGREGIPINLGWDWDARWIDSGETDASGKVTFLMSGSLVSVANGCSGDVTRRLYAEADDGHRVYHSGYLPIIFKPLLISLTISYSHTGDYSTQYLTETINASILGTITGPTCANGSPYSTGELTRTYNYVYQTQTVTQTKRIIGNERVTECYASAAMEEVISPNGVAVHVLRGVTVWDMCGLLADAIVEYCDSYAGTCDTIPEGGIPCGNTTGSVAYPFTCLIGDDDDIYFENIGSGDFETYLWDYENVTQYYSRRAMLSVSVSAGF